MNMDRLAALVALSLLVFANPRLAGDGDIISMLKAKMQSERRGEPRLNIRITDEQLREADPNQVLAALAPYEKEEDWSVRHAAHAYLVRTATLHPTTRVRREVVGRLIDSAYTKQESSNEVELLMRFTAKDFDERAKGVIRQAMAKDRIGVATIRLCGVANLQDQLPRLEALLIDEVAYANDPNLRVSAAMKKYGALDEQTRRFYEERLRMLHRLLPTKWYRTLSWEARLARARMGVKEDIARCIELAEREEDKRERVLTILPQIGYIRQPEAIEYLRKYLESDERLPRMGGRRQPYADRVMYILAECLEDYPIEQRPGFTYGPEEIELCRKWMAGRTEWKIIR